MTVCKSFYFFILFAVILVGCSKNTGKDKKSQVAATVNGVEITESQIDYLFKRSSQSRMSSSEILNLRRSILADIVRTELLAQKATKMNLDKSSDYKNGMFNASKEVLADLAIQKTINKIPNFNNEQLNSIVLNNPMVFEKRKLYVYEEIIIPTIDIKTIESIDKKIEDGYSLKLIKDELIKIKVPFRQTLRSVTSDQIPPEMETALDRIGIGSVQVIRVMDNKFTFIINLHNRLQAPVTGENARRQAVTLLNRKQKSDAIQNAVTELINSSAIAYYGDYAKKVDVSSQDLPLPDYKKVIKVKNKKIFLSLFLLFSIGSTILVITSLMQIKFGKLWLPRLLPNKNKNKEENTLEYEIPFEMNIVQKVFNLIIASVVVYILGYEINVLRDNINILFMIVSIVSGIVLGVMLSRLFKLTRLQNKSDFVYNIIAIVFIIPIIINLLMILRFSAL